MFVADIARADELLTALSRDMRLPDRAPRRNVSEAPVLTEADLDPALIARIRAMCPLDTALWQRWQDRGWKAEGRDPAAPPPPLPDDDRLRALAGDAVTTLRRLRLH